MNVLHVQTSTGLSGGIAMYVSQIVKAGVDSGINQFVVVPGAKDSFAKTDVTYGNAIIVRLPETYTLRTIFRYLARLKKAVTANKIDIVHAHALRSAVPAAIAATLSGVPLVYTNHGLRYKQKNSIVLTFLFWTIELLVCRASTIICCIRRTDYCVMMKNCWLASRSRLRLVETRIDGRVENETRFVKDADGKLRLVGVGGLIPVKRPIIFLEWLIALRDIGVEFVATWIGDGPLRSIVESRALEAGLPVKFAGMLPRRAVLNILEESDIMLLTSSFETLPLAVLEAYSCGVPVVSTRFGGVEDFVVDGETGIIVAKDEAKAAARAIAKLWQTPSVLEFMKNRARSVFKERYSNSTQMAEKYIDLYLDVMK